MLIQLMIAATGITAIFLTQAESTQWQRYACLFGLAGQPFWIVETYQNEQWGIFIVSLFYTLAWLKGFKRYWL